MVKIHTRRKRTLAKLDPGNRERPGRPKTFASEVAARDWAQKNKIKDYTLEDMTEASPKRHKFRIVEKK
ncbi:MAG: hypothetical protein ABIC95_03370 [archaeon]